MGEKNERKKEKKCADHVREKCETKLVSGLVSENASSNLVSNFSHQFFLVKMVRLLGLGSGFSVFSSNWLTKITKKLFW
jgi:hypothetical protein